LTCGTSYTVAVDASDAAGNRSAQATATMATAACSLPVPTGDTQPPSVPQGLRVAGTTPASVTLAWNASTDNVGVTGYRLYNGSTVVGTTTQLTYTFTALQCGTPYALSVVAYDAAGNSSSRPDAVAQVTTAACASDTQSPSVPQGLRVTGTTATSMSLAWDASTDNVGVAGYRLYNGSTVVGTTAQLTYAFTGLQCGTTYALSVVAYDAAGNTSNRLEAVAQVATAACSGGSDTTPPSAPTSLTPTGSTPTSVSLFWGVALDNVGVAGYGVYIGASRVATTTSTSFTVSGLTCATSYTFAVDAVDAAGNRSALATLSATTSPCGDATAPSVPTGLVATAETPTSISVAWTPSTDNVGVIGYRLYRNGGQVGSTGGANYSFPSLTCGTSYTLGVAAYDAAGNVSGTASFAASTTPCSTTATANVFVSTSGSDSTCMRGDSSKPCASFAKACSIAQSGDSVRVAQGNYPPQQLRNTDCRNASSSGRITFVGETATALPPTGATSDAPFINGACARNCGGALLLETGSGPFGSGGSGIGAPNYVTLRNFRIAGELEAAGDQSRTVNGSASGVGLVFDNLTVGAVYLVGLTDYLLDHSIMGDCYGDGSHSCNAAQSNDWSMAGAHGERQASSGTIQNSVFHDYWRPTADHGECFFALDWRSVTVRNTRFYNCTVSGGIRIERITNPPSGSLLTIENNWFGNMYDSLANPAERRCEAITWGANSGALSDVLIRYNTFAAGSGPFGSSGSPTSTFRILGNLVGFNPNGSCEITPANKNYGSATVKYNVWVGADAGANSAHVSSTTSFNELLMNPAGNSSMNFHLAGSGLPVDYVPCSSGDSQLAGDYDGGPRPQGIQCEAGADER
jgi:chitodextrinase